MNTPAPPGQGRPQGKLKSIVQIAKLLPLVLLGSCSAVDLINSVSKLHPVVVEKDLAFDTHPRGRMDLYLPQAANRPNSGKTPVIVFFYGGSWNRGEKSEYEFVGRKLASLGYITAIPNYRVYPEVRYPDFLRDGAKASSALLELLKKPEYQRYRPEDTLIFMGHSAGAYNAAMLAMDDRWLGEQALQRKQVVKGLIGMAGAYNIYPIFVEEVRPVFNHPDYPPMSQPIDYSQTAQIPTLLLAPETDELVSIEKNSMRLNEALQAQGTASRLVRVKGTDHITLIGTLSPVLFFKGDSIGPIQDFVSKLNQNPGHTQ